MKFQIDVKVVANEVNKTQKEGGINEATGLGLSRVIVLHLPSFEHLQKFMSAMNTTIDSHDQFKEIN